MKVDGALTNLLQGISQQPQATRLPGQCTDQVNAVNDVVDGWKRRPPTQFISALLGVSGSNAPRWHFYDTGIEQYIVCVTSDGSLYVFDLDGTPFTVAGASTRKALLSFTKPEDLSLVTIGDYTLIANSNIIPAMSTDLQESFSNTAIVYLKDGGEYGRRYAVSIDGLVVASYVTPGGSDAKADAPKTGTEHVTQALYDQLRVKPAANVAAAQADFDNAAYWANFYYTLLASSQQWWLAYGAVYYEWVAKKEYYQAVLIATQTPDPTSETRAQYEYKIKGSSIEVKRITGTDNINIEVTDDRGGQFAKIIQRSALKPGDLPKYATPGQIVQITGDGSSEKDDYYLKFTIEHGLNEFGVAGVWRECAKPGITRKLNGATMPHALIRLPDSSWAFTPVDGSVLTYQGGTFTTEHWRYRSCGTEDTNKVPSFVGKPIVFMGTFQDRLYMLSDENAVFSATSSYFNFFCKTAITILDSDPVDMPSAGNSIVKLKRATQHDKNLIIFSDKSQFVVPGNKELTPKSSMILTTSYESELISVPVPAGEGVLFPITYGEYSGVREFITTASSDTNSSQPITAHVPKLIKGAIRTMVVSSNFDVVLISSTGGDNRLYVYKYMWQDGTRKQAAWGVWEFSKAVSTVFMRDAVVYVVMYDNDTYSLEKIDLTDVPPADMEHNVFLDSRAVVSPVGNTLEVPYVFSSPPVVVQGPGCEYPGEIIPVENFMETTLELSSVPTGVCFVGVPFTSSYTPTMPVIKDQNNGLISNANLIVGNFTITFKDTGGFNAVVKNPHYPEYTARYSGRTLSTPSNIVGALPVSSGSFKVPVRKDAKSTTLKIETSQHFPMNLTAIEWDGDYTKRGRRL